MQKGSGDGLIPETYVADNDLGDLDRMDDVRATGTPADILMSLISEIKGFLDDIQFLLVGASFPGGLLQLGIALLDNLVVVFCELGETHASIFFKSLVSSSFFWIIWKE